MINDDNDDTDNHNTTNHIQQTHTKPNIQT